MSFRKAFCPNCGAETQLDDTRAFCFCLQCGYKIILQGGGTVPVPQQPEIPTQTSNADNPKPLGEKMQAENPKALEEKLQEVEFYYQLSVDKCEYLSLDSDPFYYLKAQDLLIDLSSKYSDDYRVWWLLSQPVDFAVVDKTVDLNNQFTINETYFEKALDFANIDKKKQLILARDRYLSDKSKVQEQQRRQQAEEEQKRRKEEEIKQQEAEQQRIENERKMRAQQEAEEKAKIESEHKRLAEEALLLQQREQLNVPLWTALSEKDYSSIDGCYFKLNTQDNLIYIGVFKCVSNVLYLMSFRVDSAKGGIVYKEQNLAVAVNDRGEVVNFNRSPVRLRDTGHGIIPLQIICTDPNTLFVAGIPLLRDNNYIRNLIQKAKKPLITTNKLFL